MPSAGCSIWKQQRSGGARTTKRGASS
jgi:hypothetical protein